MRKLGIPIICYFMITSCGTHKQVAGKPSKRMPKSDGITYEINVPEKSHWEAKDKVDRKDVNLRAFVADWEGTPHVMGGNTKKGVDCSGFVIQAYLQVYHLGFLGRTAEDLFSEMEPIKRKDLKEGDLVFFKIKGHRIDHVGIYLGKGDFAHASSSRGVMVSNLSEPYFNKRFFMGGRKTTNTAQN